jgi:flagellar assembly protein FliH
MTSSRRGILRAAELADVGHAVPVRSAPGPLTLAGAGGPQALAANAEAEARAIIAEAEALRDEMVREAWNEGFTQGLNDAAARMADAVTALEGLMAAVGAELDALPDVLSEETTAVALEVAARIVRAELTVNPDRVLDVVRGAVRRATERERLLVHVNPVDLDLVRQAAPELMVRIGGIQRLDVVDDPRIPAGGCVVETPAGDVDARLGVQLQRLAEALASGGDDDLHDAA